MQKELSLESYRIELPLDRLKLGVDNLRYDVRLSPKFISIGSRLAFQLIIKHSEASPPLCPDEPWNHLQETRRFKSACRELLANAVHQAKSLQEIQVDYLAQVAVARWITRQIGDQYEKAVQHFKNVVRKHEISGQTDMQIQLREELSGISQKKNEILYHVGEEMFTCFLEARRKVDQLRLLNFGDDHLLPEELFSNPLLQTAFRPDDFFMMKHYVLLGHRIEDPLNYPSILTIMHSYFDTLSENGYEKPESGADLTGTEGSRNGSESDHLIKQAENIDCLFNYPATRELIRQKVAGSAPRALKSSAKDQKKRLDRLYTTFAREKMISGIAAAYNISDAVDQYCPPLKPQEILQYIVVPKARKSILRKIQRAGKYSNKTLSPVGLRRTASGLKLISKKKKRALLIDFLKDFANYHRDLDNYHLFRKAADCIHFLEEDRIIKLSRGNHTLYEFILPKEKRTRKAPIINHVIIKADVRGSTEIIAQMKEIGMNPASNFSLNFFDPIRKLLSIYGASKVFIEGDAIILSIMEKDGAPDRWYGVARACGLAANILMVVKRYNIKNRKNRLPRLDLGIGISFSASAPTFFYDDNHPIMISPSINEADRLSKCDRVLRERLSRNRSPFHLHVCEIDTSSINSAELLNSPVLRYNVMGIELSRAGFIKLSREIHLKRFRARIPGFQDDPFTAYTGKFPTASGHYQRIIIREADVPLISPRDFSTVSRTGRKYYEILTRPEIYDYVKEMT